MEAEKPPFQVAQTKGKCWRSKQRVELAAFSIRPRHSVKRQRYPGGMQAGPGPYLVSPFATLDRILTCGGAPRCLWWGEGATGELGVGEV